MRRVPRNISRVCRPTIGPFWLCCRPRTANGTVLFSGTPRILPKAWLADFCPTVTLDAMKTVTTREFFHTPGLVKSLQPGHSLVVTDKGAPAFTVTKAGRRRKRTRADLEREAARIC